MKWRYRPIAVSQKVMNPASIVNFWAICEKMKIHIVYCITSPKFMTNLAMERVADSFESIIKELRKESPRGSVVLAVSWIDEHLTLLIKSFLVAPIGAKDELIDVGKPMGNFGVKIHLAYRLGLIREKTFRSLEIFRRLRNDFAHLSSSITFETDSVRSRVHEVFRLNELILASVWDAVNVGVDREETSSWEKVESLLQKNDVRFLFELCAATTAAGLLLTLSQVDPLKELN